MLHMVLQFFERRHSAALAHRVQQGLLLCRPCGDPWEEERQREEDTAEAHDEEQPNSEAEYVAGVGKFVFAYIV